MEHVLVFHPGESSFIALWQPGLTRQWVEQPVQKGSKQGIALYAAIEDLLRSESLPMANVTHIGVMHGPASYSQLRSFIAAANSLAWALRLPIFSFPPQTRLPDSLPELTHQAKVNTPIEPVYPASIG